MARPAKFDREKAVAFAMNEFWREGYGANSVKSLSEKLGITRSSFYNAFGDREGLFGEAFALYLNQSPDRAFQDASPDMPVKQLFTDTFRTICKVRSADTETRGCLVVNGIAELCNTNDTIGPMLQKTMLESIARIETILGWGVASGEIGKETDIHALALSVQNLIVGLNVLCKLVRREEELWNIASTTLHGLGLLNKKGTQY